MDIIKIILYIFWPLSVLSDQAIINILSNLTATLFTGSSRSRYTCSQNIVMPNEVVHQRDIFLVLDTDDYVSWDQHTSHPSAVVTFRQNCLHLLQPFLIP